MKPPTTVRWDLKMSIVMTINHLKLTLSKLTISFCKFESPLPHQLSWKSSTDGSRSNPYVASAVVMNVVGWGGPSGLGIMSGRGEAIGRDICV